MNWDDLRIIASIRAAGSFSGAARHLCVDETTVGRRLARLQADIGVNLFDAVDGRRRPTAACERILRHVDEISRRVDAIRQIATPGDQPMGRLRIASTSAIAEAVLAPTAAELLEKHPGITLQFLTSTATARLDRWEADIAIRLRRPAQGSFIISKLADIRFVLVEPNGIDRNDPTTVVCAYPDDLDFSPETKTLSALGLQSTARCLASDGHVIRQLVRSRRAVGVLPEYLSAELLHDDGFRITPLDEQREAWLLVQPHLRSDAATRIVTRWIRGCFAAL